MGEPRNATYTRKCDDANDAVLECKQVKLAATDVTHLRTGVSAELLVDLVDTVGNVLKALVEEPEAPGLYLMKLLLAAAGHLSAGIKS